MQTRRALALLLSLLASSAGPALAQAPGLLDSATGVKIPPAVLYCKQPSGRAAPCGSADSPLYVGGGGGGGGGGTSTANQGAAGSAPWPVTWGGGLSVGVSSLPALPTGANAIGTVGVTALPPLPSGTNALGTVGVTALPALPVGGNAIGTVGVTALPALPVGGNAIGTVGVTALPALPTGSNVVGSIANAFLLDSTFTSRVPTVGQKTSAASLPVVLPSDYAPATQGASAPGAAAASATLVGGVYRAATPAPTDGQQVSLTLDATGALRVATGATPAPVTSAGSSAATAQAVQGVQGGVPQNATAVQYNSVLPTLTSGGTGYLAADANGRLLLAPGSTVTATGSAAAGTADSGSPIKVGCVYNSTLPTYTTGQRTDCQSNSRGFQAVAVGDNTGNYAGINYPNADGIASTNSLAALGYTYVYNGTAANWERTRTAPSAAGTSGVGVLGVALAPLSGTVGIASVASTASASVFKASAGNVYGYSFTQSSSTAGYFVFLNVATAPTAGAAITPVNCVPVAAGGFYQQANQAIPERFSAGITVVSSMSCTTYTANPPTLMKVNAL